ncbi:MAG: MmgE/PrpD family protein, partial [Chloroflexota bacterium]|nr:MmgE/PrpD family protein [Chloroflexota bacterium]
TVVPAALAVAEAKGGVSGKEFITAVCQGLDVGCRIGLATNPKPSHAGAPAPGYFGSAVACAKVLGLDEEQVLDAMSISYCQLAVGGLSIIAPALTKRLTAGFSARAGAFAATLASRGFPGSRGIFQGERGYFPLYRGREGDLETLTQDLGKRFEITHCPKPYPSCRFTQAPIDATFALLKEYKLRPEDIHEVRVYLSGRAIHIGGGVDGALLSRKRRPLGVVDAQFSAPYTVATAIVKGRVAIADFAPSALSDPVVLAMAERVVPVLDRKLDDVPDIITPAVVEIKTRDGRSLERRVDHAKGSPQNPMTPEELREKFWGCVAEAARPLARARVEKAASLLEHLETVRDVREIAPLLAA